MLRYILQKIFLFIALLRIGKIESLPLVNGYTRFTRFTTLGKNTNFNGMVIYGSGRVAIGDNFHSGSGCKIITQSHNYDGNSLPYDTTYKTFSVDIGDNVWLGMDVTVIGNVTIGEGAIIQVGSVVVSDIPRCAIAGGHPARVFSSRNIEKYDQFVRERRFH